MTGLFISIIIPAKALRIQLQKERRIVMTTIDKAKTGQQIRLLMEKRGVTVRDVKNALSLACVQSVYHWLDGQSMPTLDNLYALSDLLKVPMDMLVYGNRRYDPNKNIPEGAERLFRYYRLIQECMAA
jgi:transcriptional regulator with XRE-family HTH domain